MTPSLRRSKSDLASSQGALAALEPELQRDARHFEEARRVAQGLVRHLSDEQLAWKPVRREWSILECLSHLTLAAEAHIPLLEEAIARGRDRGMTGAGPFRHGWLVDWLIGFTEPPPKMKLRAPGIFRPRAAADPDRILDSFIECQYALMRLAQEANGLHLARLRITSPTSRFLKMSLGQCFALLAAHQRRHLWQAQRVRERDGFPAVTDTEP